jgi:membrane glycosyltransferase
VDTIFVENIGRTTAEERQLRPRRALVLALNLASWLGLSFTMAQIVGGAGWSWAGATIMLLYLIALPWTLLAFWNAVIGFFILKLHKNPASYTNPALRATPADARIFSRTALCVCIRHENVEGVATRLSAMRSSLEIIGQSANFEFHVLSDSARPEICAEEESVLGMILR